MLAEWKIADAEHFSSADSLYFYHQRQIDDFLTAVSNGTKPLVGGLVGRKTVKLFTAIFRSTQTNAGIKFPLRSERAQCRFGMFRDACLHEPPNDR